MLCFSSSRWPLVVSRGTAGALPGPLWLWLSSGTGVMVLVVGFVMRAPLRCSRRRTTRGTGGWFRTSSCPGLSRASTSLLHERKDVDGRVKPGHDEKNTTPFEGGTLQLLLSRRRLGLARLAVLFVGAVAAIGAAGDGAEHAVVSGIVTGDAADHGALQTALGVGRRGGNDRERGDGENGGWGFHDAMNS